MAKKRVYELARELNMTNRQLLDRIRELDIPAKTHMSSLDPDDVSKIKAAIFGNKEASVRETRVSPTVIRRPKAAPAEPEDPGKADIADPEAAVAETPPVEAAEKDLPEEKASDLPAEGCADEKTADQETESTSDTEKTPPAVAEETPADKEKTVIRRKKRPPKEPSARIVRMPDPPKPPEPEPEAAEKSVASEKTGKPVLPVATEKGADAAAQPAETISDEAKPPEGGTLASEKTAEALTQEGAETPAEITPEIPVPDETPAPEKPEAAPPKIQKPKKPKETPAKIIRMPDPARTIAPSSAPPPRPAAGDTGKAGGWPPKKAKTSKKSGRGDSGDDRRFFKKKISFKRKEVVEGDRLYSGKRGRKGRKQGRGKAAAKPQKTQLTVAKAIKRRIKVDDTIVLAELAKRMGIKANEMIVKLMGLGVMATVNQLLDFETATLVAAEFDYEVEKAGFEEETLLEREKDDPEKMENRPPVVTIMGHVDHGKTSLLDVIRRSRVTAGEAGGITQHIGAYHVRTASGQIVFLDTPGHEAFTAMRSRGASVTDIVILVVAADDGVMPQTVEAVNHSKAAGVPIIVAVNKMDKPGAQPERVIRQLAELGLAPEDWGGETIFVQVSAKQKTGIEELLEMVLLQSEMLELKANPGKRAFGHVVEAQLDAGRGPVATVLVQDGTLETGDAVVCGVHHGRVRSLLNDRGEKVEKAGPSMPVEILGLSGVPQAGDELVALADEKDAKNVSTHRMQKLREKELARSNRMSLDKLFEKMREEELQDLNIVLKADVHGSIEALQESLLKLSNEEVNINIVHSATGAINESDVSLAAVSDAIIIGFNVRPTPKVQAMASEENVDMRFYNVIYNVIQDVKSAISGMMASTFEEHLLGRAEVRQTFTVPKIGTIAGCYVTDGKIERGGKVRLVRDGVVVFEGKISSLRRFKDDVKEVQSSYECGIGIERYNDVKPEDVIECFYMEEIRPEIE